jgi:hypothetical protein
MFWNEAIVNTDPLMICHSLTAVKLLADLTLNYLVITDRNIRFFCSPLLGLNINI